MVIKTKAPRWYQWKDGVITPCYELKKKSGNGMKAYSLREARELHLLPSITSVLQVIDKPELDNWRVSQAIHAAMTLPRFPDEGEDSFANRVLADSEEQSTKACEFGTRIHDAMAKWIETGIAERDVDTFPYIEYLIKWADENIEEVHAVEKTVGHPSIGVAGRLDLDCTLKDVGRTICDFKSQALKKNEATFWEDWAYQLAAYSQCTALTEHSLSWPRIMSVVIPSNEPGPVQTKLWTVVEQEDGYRVFGHALGIWIRLRGRGYDPRQ